MISIDENALICDLAETYGIFDYRELPVAKLAILASGLRDGSRIKMKIRNENTDFTNILLAVIADRLGILAWMQSEDGAKNRNKPKSIVDALYGQKKEGNERIFESGEAFKKEWERLTGNG